jgi:hypothetical protein
MLNIYYNVGEIMDDNKQQVPLFKQSVKKERNLSVSLNMLPRQ